MGNLAFSGIKPITARLSWQSEIERFAAKSRLLADKVDNKRLKQYALNTVSCLNEQRYIVSQCQDCGNITVKPLRCKHRFFCPDCGRELSRRALGRFSHIIRKNQDKKTNVYFLTVTISNPTILTLDYIKKFKNCFYKLRRPEDSPIHGNGIARIECPPGGEGTWNLHLHCVFYSERSDRGTIQWELMNRWKTITRKVFGKESFILKVQTAEKKHMVELLKYVMKFPDAEKILNDENKYSEFMTAFAHIRLLWTWGDIYAIKKIMHYICFECGSISGKHKIKSEKSLFCCNSPPKIY